MTISVSIVITIFMTTMTSIMVGTILLRQPRPVQDLPLLEVTSDPSPPPRECHHHHDLDERYNDDVAAAVYDEHVDDNGAGWTSRVRS